ncbi:MAG TPA: O-succinylhomoserine sulfhydrylase [Ferrovibrio sp.]|jgi:O-succinylhomoserine sulfhydrylase|uniref:O-succinylhomoserine sulfhydrylase n=1 Tax=Ferrovibrio sp. TaxID=1917215 RepID=UPI002B4B0C6E|nr:O-succinylhomoserine sulfhydrylase [Ferrovibrio sp.]HLT76629.1 O-succinylhomoserine sulfhydrylase [Ferrovibrio sp.]
MDDASGGKGKNTQGWRLATRMVRGATQRSPYGETSEALFLNSGFTYENAEAAEARFKGEQPGFVYSRYENPTVRMFEQRMALIEGAEDARATASGMAAVNAALTCQLRAGDEIVCSRAVFGSIAYIVNDLLPRFGVKSTMVDGTDLAQWEAAITPRTRVVFLETPANPTLELVDIAAVAALAHRHGARLVIDNVFATPVLQKPLELGADIVVYSATKHIDGQGRCLGGIVLGPKSFIEDELAPYLKHTGPALSPFNAWVLLKGLETLELRVARHVSNAASVADALAAHPQVAKLIYPGRPDHPQHALARRQMSAGGGMIAFAPKGGKAAAFRFLNALKIIDISNNLGDAKSLVTHPATTTHQRLSEEERARLGISDDLLRLSVGLEDPRDLIEDLLQALENAS